MTFFMIAPICAGDLLIVTPADSKALILSVAVPLPPAMIAPAWPIRLPGGAVKPAAKEKDTTCDPSQSIVLQIAFVSSEPELH